MAANSGWPRERASWAGRLHARSQAAQLAGRSSNQPHASVGDRLLPTMTSDSTSEELAGNLPRFVHRQDLVALWHGMQHVECANRFLDGA